MNVVEYIETIKSNPAKFKIVTKNGLAFSEIDELERKLSIKLPGDLVSFYYHSNGLEGDDWIFNIIPLNEVEKLTDEEGEYLSFAEYMIYSDMCGLCIDKVDSNRYKIFRYRQEGDNNKIQKRQYFASSIVDFIQLYCDKGTFGVFSEE
jgi:hypothetical protein